MNTKTRFALILTLALLGGTALAAVAWATPGNAPLAQGGSPAVVAYQGEVRVSDAPYTGTGYFKFAVVNADGSVSYWSNDGSSTVGDAPTAAVQLAVSDGLFGVLLGDTTLGGMTQALTAGVFSQPDRYLRVWFSDDGSDFDQLSPDTRIAAVPYALQAQEAADADTVDGMHASELETHYQNVVIVAKSGGDYASVQAAIDSISDAAAANPYLVWVAPGVYEEQVTMQPYVHLQGAGQEATVITSTASSSAWPPAQATLVLASDTSLRDLTLGNGSAGATSAALLATAGMTRTLAANVTARALGVGGTNCAIVLRGSGAGITLQGVTALAENGSYTNLGLLIWDGAAATLRGGSFTGRGGTGTRGIFNRGTGSTLEAGSVTVLAEIGTDTNFGLYNYGGAAATLHGGSFTGRGGVTTRGIASAGSGSTLTAESVTALGENGSSYNIGFGNYDGVTSTLRGGVFIARGGTDAYGISNMLTVTMKADNVTALAENGSGDNYGFWNVNNATAVVHNASFTARGGTNAVGIDNHGTGTTLEAESVTAQGKDGSDNNYGLLVYDGAAATLRGGSFTARGGTSAYGIYNAASDTTLEATSVTALGENGSIENYGLVNYGATTLFNGSFIARGGTSARGIHNYGSSATLEVEGVTALAENGSINNFGLFNEADAAATLRRGAFTGRGGPEAIGILNGGSNTTLEAESVTALGENGSSSNFGLSNNGGAEAKLSGGSFTGRGGIRAYGIFNYQSGTTLEANSVTALGENGSTLSFGLENHGGAVATLRGGNFTGREGGGASGVQNTLNSILTAENITALAENGSNENYGMFNNNTVTATLSGGAFTGRGGTNAYGICNELTATLKAENVTGLAVNGSNNNYGMYNVNNSTAVLRGSSFTGNGGTNAHGIGNFDDNTMLDAASVTALGENGSNFNFGLISGNSTTNATANMTQSVLEGATNSVLLDSGTVTVSNSRLAGNSVSVVSGTLTCVAVSRGGTFMANGCP